MSDVFTVTWSENMVELRQVSSVGTWQPRTQPIRSFKLQRPTRSDRLNDADSGRSLGKAISALLLDVEITIPVWFLIPNSWVQSYKLDNPRIESETLLQSHLIWEAQQRLSGDLSEFKIVLPVNLDDPKLTVRTYRHEVEEVIKLQIKESGIDSMNIGFEPGWSETYDFEAPVDLSHGVLADSIDTRIMTDYLFIPLKLSVPILTGLLLIVGYLLLHYPVVPDEITPAAVTSSGSTESAGSPKTILNTSPINEVVSLLPEGAEILFGVFSSVDCKFEIAGINDPSAWLENLKKMTSLKWVEISDSYSSAGRSVTVISQNQTGWKPGSLKRDLDHWNKITRANGMNPKGRTSSGSYEAALKLLDEIWKSPGGFEKVYFSAGRQGCIVTVQ